MRNSIRLAAAVLATLLASTLAASAEPVRVPLRKDYGGRLIVSVRVNGEGPFDFIVDTAASQSVFFENLAARLALDPSGEADARVIGFSGARTAPSFIANTLELGALRVEGAEVLRIPDWPGGEETPQGVIGLDLLEGRLVVVDALSKQLSIYSGDEFAPEIDGWAKAPLRRDDFGFAGAELAVVDVAFRVGLARITIPFLIDSGADAAVCNYPAAIELRVIPIRQRLAQNRKEVSDAHGERIVTYRFSTPLLKIGDARWENGSMLTSDAPFFDEIGYGGEPFGVLGLDYLADNGFAIDLRSNEIYFDRPRD